MYRKVISVIERFEIKSMTVEVEKVDGDTDLTITGPRCSAHVGLAPEDASKIARALAPSVPQVPQPIESAPKDGTPILVRCPHGWYAATWFWDYQPDCPDAGISWWYVDDNKHGPFPLRGASPTHWLPLPPPPGEVAPQVCPNCEEMRRKLEAINRHTNWRNDEVSKYVAALSTIQSLREGGE